MTEQVAIALAGDVMLGRLVNETIRACGYAYPWGDMLPTLQEADVFMINLECALTGHARPWGGGTAKMFYFRADPPVLQTLQLAGVDYASLANNHAGDFGDEGLLETVRLLDSAGIKHAGAGADLAATREPARLEARDLRISVLSFADYPGEWAAAPGKVGINYTPVSLQPGNFGRVRTAIADAREGADLVVFSIHWGPNMNDRPLKGFREFARAVIDAGVDVFWGHSAHVVQGVEIHGGKPILYDTGDFVDDYAVDARLRNDLSALFRIVISDGELHSVEVVPVKIDYMQVNHVRGEERGWFLRRFTELCREMTTEVSEAECGAIINLKSRPE
jgi:poly-gamma-glutamate capsule biosynthesis protein CapA/YwtB (metallophosphatase superfamily)